MGLHLVLKYSISYMELETEDDNSMYPRELKGPAGDRLSHDNHHRHLQQEEHHQTDNGLVPGLTGTAHPYSLEFLYILLSHIKVKCFQKNETSNAEKTESKCCHFFVI